VSYTSLTIVQPSWLYIEDNIYEVVPAVVNLTFTNPPSIVAGDYVVNSLTQDLMSTFNFNPSILEGNLLVVGNVASITMPINFSYGFANITYQGLKLPFQLNFAEDPIHNLPAIWKQSPVQ
jgi:hypothetical protein